jgi:hypothetical protein
VGDAAPSSLSADAGIPSSDAAVAASAPDAGAQTAVEGAATRGPQAAALAALDAQHARLASCYDGLLATAPDALGRVSVELAVTSANEITRVDVRVEGDGPLASARACIEAALRGARFTGTPAVGSVVRRSYSFVNPPVELSAPSALRVQAPARNGRPAETAPAASATATPDAGASAESPRGVLTAAEVGAQLAQATTALQACYATALRRASRAAGNGDLRFSIQQDGQVSSATWGASSEPIALMGECIGAAVRAQRFRASGTMANVRASVEFAR